MALLLTLWSVAILAVAVVAAVRVVDGSVEDASFFNRKFEARLLALSGVAYGLNPRVPRASELLHQETEKGVGFNVSVTGENGRLSINRYAQERSKGVLLDLFRIWGVPEDQRRIAVDSLVDWVDVDDLRSMHGAERKDLAGQTRYLMPQNRPFKSLDEVARVRGMDAVAAAKPDWRDYFSVAGHSKLSIQDASVDVLRVLSGLSQPQVEALVRFRNGPDGKPETEDDGIISDVADLTKLLGLNQAQQKVLDDRFEVTSKLYRIESIGQVRGVKYRIQTIVDKSAADTVIYCSWEEG